MNCQKKYRIIKIIFLLKTQTRTIYIVLSAHFDMHRVLQMLFVHPLYPVNDQTPFSSQITIITLVLFKDINTGIILVIRYEIITQTLPCQGNWVNSISPYRNIGDRLRFILPLRHQAVEEDTCPMLSKRSNDTSPRMSGILIEFNHRQP